MPNPNAIVGTVAAIEPSLERPTTETLKRYPEGVAVELEDGRTVRLDPADERSPGFARILAQVQRLERPVYLEVDEESRFVERLRIPLLVTVADIRETESGDLDVELEISHARHVLRRDRPDFAELHEALRSARNRGGQVAVTETEEHEILDVRSWERTGQPPPSELREPAKVERVSWLRRLWRWLWGWFRCVSKRRAQQLFDLCKARSCDPLAVPAPCIPFLYPDDGCWGRAHEMVRLMIDAGAKPKKVWIYGSLNTPTRNNPNCHVLWGWHVAPTLCVRKWFFFGKQEKVVDPALFDTPVSKATWKGVQGDPNAQLVDTSAAIFYRSFNGSTQTDPNYVQTQSVLATYRLQLQTRSVNIGPPPYAQCP